MRQLQRIESYLTDVVRYVSRLGCSVRYRLRSISREWASKAVLDTGLPAKTAS